MNWAELKLCPNKLDFYKKFIVITIRLISTLNNLCDRT